jgi:iron complex outermembrane receptor protein
VGTIRIVVGSMAAVAAGWSATASAQTAGTAATPQTGLAEITVTAERREASLQTVPVAVSALDTTALENRQVTEAEDLQRLVPSLKMANNITSPTNLSPSLRGSLQQDASLVVAESPFGIYVDDVYIARLNGNNVTLADVERVEVLRGPQGTLYGRNTLSGAIKFVTRTPGDESWANLRVGGGNWDQYLVSGSVGGPLGDAWSASLAGQVNHKDGQFTNVRTGRKTGLEENWAARGKLRYRGGEQLDAVLSLSYSDSKNDALQLLPRSTPGIPSNCSLPTVPRGTVCQFTSDDLAPPPGFPVYGVGTPTGIGAPAPITDPPSGRTKQTIASLNVAWDFGAATLRSITGYVKVEDRFSTDFSGIGVTIGAATIDDDHFSQELQLQGTALGDRLNYIVGAYYFDESGEQDFGWRIVTPLSTSQIDATTKSYAAFGQLDYRLTDALKGTAGVRWVEDKKTFGLDYQRLAGNVIGLPALVDRVRLDDVYTEVTPRFGLDYTIAPGGAVDSMLLFASAAKGFKSGGYNGINIVNANIARVPYAPESNWTYEAGLKTDLLDRRLRINANYFYAKISDLALNATVEVAPGIFDFPVQNAGEATIQGLEFEITARPIESLTVFLNGALQDGKYDSLNPTSAPAQAPALYGVKASPPQVPDYTFTVGFDWSIPVSVAGGSRFSVGADYFRTDEFVTAATNDFVTSAYDRTSAYASMQFGANWEVRFDVKNLTDEETIASGSRGLGGFIILPPREYLFSVTYRM